MSRIPTALSVSFLLFGACSDSRRGAEDAGQGLALVPLTPPPAPLPVAEVEDAGTTAPAAPIMVDPSRLKEARALVPAPLLYGQLRPVLGAWVDYALRSKETQSRVRISLVGETVREDGTPLYQLELDHETSPRTLVVLWVRGGARPFVDRLAISVPPHAPLSIPVDLHVDQPELRGVLEGERDTVLREGPFAGKAREQTFRREDGGLVGVVSTERVPLLGVESIRDAETTWVVRATGTGAKPALDSVPIAIPRVPGQ
ncbi:hypothetical protein [Myxococcus sp. CA039A]|uniref:hypothetical protein n=1 Tax=Myxococcus sp. CA039A TaxID=2741737 RepID=UPI00157BAADB|nr:hypothetical protein [Myxococcus sp. CA039A]NTX51482.1 hypothetical protein [Myxococcus sp. CA039A]